MRSFAPGISAHGAVEHHAQRAHAHTGPGAAVASWNSTIFGWYTAKSSGSVLLFSRGRIRRCRKPVGQCGCDFGQSGAAFHIDVFRGVDAVNLYGSAHFFCDCSMARLSRQMSLSVVAECRFSSILASVAKRYTASWTACMNPGHPSRKPPLEHKCLEEAERRVGKEFLSCCSQVRGVRPRGRCRR